MADRQVIEACQVVGGGRKGSRCMSDDDRPGKRPAMLLTMLNVGRKKGDNLGDGSMEEVGNRDIPNL